MSAGLPGWLAPLTAIIVLGGSIEFVMIALISGGASLAIMAATTFAVNFRHVFYPLSYPRHLIRTSWGWFYGAFSLTDEVYAILNGRHGLTSQRQVLLFQFGGHLTWAVSAACGVLLGQIIPPEFKGLDFAMVAMFTVLALDFFAHSRQLRPLLYSLAASSIAWVVFPGKFLLSALLIFLAACLVDAVVQAKKGSAASAGSADEVTL